VCPNDRHPILKIYLKTLDRYEYMPVANVTRHCI